MSALEALWLGLVQGLTEFFPVSSSGHLVLFEQLLGVHTEGGLLFEVAVHVATLVAILLFYHRKILQLVRGALQLDRDVLRYVGKLAVGTLPAVVVGLVAKDFVENQFSAVPVVSVALLVTGAVVWTTRTTASGAETREPSWLAALLIGCAQALAILPGISRSGSTVAVALALGIRPLEAAEFSFLLGIIAITGAAVLMLPDLGDAAPAVLTAIWIGSAAALVTGVLAIWLFVRMLASGIFHYFAFWAWAVGAVFLGWYWIG